MEMEYHVIMMDKNGKVTVLSSYKNLPDAQKEAIGLVDIGWDKK